MFVNVSVLTEIRVYFDRLSLLSELETCKQIDKGAGPVTATSSGLCAVIFSHNEDIKDGSSSTSPVRALFIHK